jgi:uncharacterized protein
LQKRNRIYLLASIALLGLLIFFGNRIATFYTDWLWFVEMRQRVVFTKIYGTRLMLFLVFGAASFLFAYINVKLADRFSPPSTIRTPDKEDLSLVHSDRPFGKTVRVLSSFRHILDILLLLGALFFGVLAGTSAQAEWDSFLRFTHPVPFGRPDPQFGIDIGFYVFTLPFLTYTAGWLLTILLLIIAGVALVYAYQEGINVASGNAMVHPYVLSHLSVLIAVALAVKAWGYSLDRYGLLFGTPLGFPGAGYTDIHVRLPMLNIMIWVTLIAALIVAMNARQRNIALPVLGIGLWLLVSFLGVIIPGIAQRVQVIPNEAERESRYIARTISATRSAYELDSVRVASYPANGSLTPNVLTQEDETLFNIRLWDFEPLLQALPSQQSFRRYYTFPRVNVDRYRFGDTTREVLLAVREIDEEGLDYRARTWSNLHLRYTHGFGAVMSPVSSVAPGGMPTFLLGDIPPVSALPELQLTQPRIYFGLKKEPNDYIIVGAGQTEFDYPEADVAGSVDQVNRYDGKAGIPLTNLNRIMMALRFASGGLLLSQQFTSSSRIVMHMRVANRVKRLAPFLLMDNTPYPVIVNGRIVWVQDAYTTTTDYPYSAAVEGTDNLSPTLRFNYIRHSVKATVDAYDGTVTLYVTDENDPVLKSYRKAMPGLFQPSVMMPEAIREHRRFPKDLFAVQRRMLADYHVLDPGLFYSRTDSWDVPLNEQEIGIATPTTPLGIEKEMPPYYLLLRPPGEKAAEFALLSPFSPRARENMIAFFVARCDGDRYGERVLYRLPLNQTIFGPEQISKRIRSDARVSPYVSQVDQKGSRVKFGMVRMIPVENSLLYVQSLYVIGRTRDEDKEKEANDENAIPELKQVVVSYKDRIAMQPTLRSALTELFGVSQETNEEANSVVKAETINALVAQAAAEYERGQNALKAGDFATYGKAAKSLGDTLRRLKVQTESAGTSKTKTTPQ